MSVILSFLSHGGPKYPDRHVQRYSVDPLTSHDPLVEFISGKLLTFYIVYD